VIILTDKEEILVQAVRTLPPEEADKVITRASQLAELAKGRQVEWSDNWTDQDLADANSGSLRGFE